MLTLYGIPNCDTVKKARAWLREQQREHHFHDFKKAGVPADALAAWVDAVGWERLLNRQGSTWRKLDEATKARLIDVPSAIAVMHTHPSVIKRPVVDDAGRITVGFDADTWAHRFG